MKFISAFLTVCGLMAAQAPQAPNPVQQSTENAARMAAGSMPIYRVTVTERTAKAINYQHRSGATKIDFRGTELLPKARGEAKVESKQGYIEIEVEFDDLQPATRQGAEYLTYVLWAISPEGRTANLGEILLNGTKSKLNVTTELQVFGLVVTAEPYYSVTRPSDLIVMENVVRADSKGKIEEIDAKYELLQRGRCSMSYLEELCGLGETMQQASKCGLGQSAPNALLSIVEHFQDEILGRVAPKRPSARRERSN
jgi:hypothetical protein